jgi:dolichyl-phosphate-mannose-protein mannosyltransferase
MKKLFSLPYSISLLSILIFSTLIRVFSLSSPAGFIFDERYHVPAIKLIAEGDERAFEWWHQPIYGKSNHDWLHPPVAKYIQAEFFKLGFGSIASWRMGSVVFGLIGIILVYIFTSLLTGNRLTGLLSSLFLSLDGLWLVQSRVAMNDVFVSVFLLMVSIFYLLFLKERNKKYLVLTGIFLGISLATKWTAAFFIIGLLAFEIIKNLQEKKNKNIPLVVFSFFILPIFIYLLSYLPALLQGKNFNFLIGLHKNIWYYQIFRDNVHPDQSTPIQWILNSKPVWYWTDWVSRNIYAVNNPLLVIFYILGLGFALYSLLKNKKYIYLLPIFFYSLSFVPWIFSPRILFYYHYTPAVPFLAVILAICFKDIYFGDKKNRNLLFLFNILLLILIFWLYYPIWIGLPVSQGLQQTVYFLLSS